MNNVIYVEVAGPEDNDNAELFKFSTLMLAVMYIISNDIIHFAISDMAHTTHDENDYKLIE